MLETSVVDLIQNQINAEMYSAYLYLDFAGYYADKGLDGFASWYNVQAKEEMEHAEKFIAYLQDNGVRPVYDVIDKPAEEIKDTKDPLVLADAHEKHVTALINSIMDEAVKMHDYRTQSFLKWFIDEQAEEEKNSAEMIQKYDNFAKDGKGLFALNESLKNRK